MHRWPAMLLLALPLVGGCAAKPAPPSLQAGDTVRPQLAFAPHAPWARGTKATIGMLVEIHRPDREQIAFLADDDALTEQADMKARVTFLRGNETLGEPLEVPFVRDC